MRDPAEKQLPVSKPLSQFVAAHCSRWTKFSASATATMGIKCVQVTLWEGGHLTTSASVISADRSDYTLGVDS